MKVYNTLTRKKEEFKPINPPKVGIYVCGITAYDSCHLGHARAAIVFDIIYRYLKFSGYDVTFARNYTDVDDKIINRANKEGKTCQEISTTYIKEYEDVMGRIGNLDPDIKPKATEHIADMIETIKKLIANGYAYEKNGDVFFSVRKFSGYGKLSGKNIDDLESGARVDVNEAKDDPLDFALWKASKPGEPEWASPWGNGRPGWHIECSAMSSKYLGQPFDIHGGGRDLIFPHHENEIAQAECAEGRPFVNCWLHNGFVNIDSEKMSKSLGNFLTIVDLLKKFHPELIRYFIISSHYRSPIDYTEESIGMAKSTIDRFYETSKKLYDAPESRSEEPKVLTEKLNGLPEKIKTAMDDDFNTAGAIGHIFDVIKEINREIDAGNITAAVKSKWRETQKLFGEIFGMMNLEPSEYFKASQALHPAADKISADEVERLLGERKAARAAKDFAKADTIKKQLVDMGLELKDKPDGTTEWHIR